MLKVLPVVLYREVKPFPIWFYLTLLDNDVSLHILVMLIVVIPTSPRTSKTEFGCKSYYRFRIGVSAVFWGPEFPVLRPDISGPGRIFPAKYPVYAPKCSAKDFFSDLVVFGGSENIRCTRKYPVLNPEFSVLAPDISGP